MSVPKFSLKRFGSTKRILSGTAEPAEAQPNMRHGRVVLGLGDEHTRGQQRAVTLLSDPWVFATRLPAGTRNPASAADLAAGRLVVPALAQPLIEQVDRYLRAQKITGVRFIDEHPAELPRLIDEYPDAALICSRKPDLAPARPAASQDRPAGAAADDEDRCASSCLPMPTLRSSFVTYGTR